MSDFLSSSSRISGFELTAKPKFSFGNKFLDDALGGIRNEDLIIVTARTGGGKTELVTQIAMANMEKGKNIHFFALEAARNEIEHRMRYKYAAQLFFSEQDWRKHRYTPNFMDYYYNEAPPCFTDYLQAVDEALIGDLKTMFTLYRDEKFDVTEFEAHVHEIADKTDLFILDNLNYMDFDDDNENRALKQTVKQIRTIQLQYHKPVVLVAQLRKRDKKTSGLLPELDDIFGSSEISKIATKIITTAPHKDKREIETVIPTLFRILKCRVDGSRCNYVGLSGFDISRNAYTPKYDVCELDFDNKEIQILDEYARPSWSKK